MNYEALIAFIVLLLFIARAIYWKVTEIQADREKPKSAKVTWRGRILKSASTFFGILISFQLLGLQILPLEMPLEVKIIGFVIVVVSMVFSFYGRYELGTNWAHAADYQIKKKHQLVTTGIYGYVRNPIYTGVLLSFVGAEIVAESYLFIIAFVVASVVLYFQAKSEEQILQKHFGKQYEEYMKRTKMFLPKVW